MGEISCKGIITLEGDRATITFRRRLSHPIDVVWAALTEPVQRAQWFGPTTLEPREGGKIEMTAEGPPAPPQHRHMHGRILVWEPPRVLEHEWQQSIVGQGTVRYELEADGDETILTFIHRGLSPVDAHGFTPGTHAFLDRLEAHLEGAELPNWLQRYDEVQPSYAQGCAFAASQGESRDVPA